jgi:TolB-like protein
VIGPTLALALLAAAMGAKPPHARAPEAKPADTRPTDAKPADTKAPDAKPADGKPADAKAPDAKPPEEVTLAAPPFETHGFAKNVDVSFYSEHFASRLSANGLQVITPQQVTTVKEMDKLRELTGCAATSADCIIELGRLLGAQGVMRGTLAKVGETLQVDVRVYQASDGKVLSSRSVSTKSNETLVRALDLMAVEIATQVKAAFGIKTVEAPRPKRPPPPPPGPDLRAVAWAPSAGGLVAGVGGAALLVLAQGARSQLKTGTPTFTQAQEIRKRGEMEASFGTGLVVAGGVGMVTAGVFALFFGPSDNTAVSVSPGPAGVTLEVKLP